MYIYIYIILCLSSVTHSNTCIIKPLTKSQEAQQREIEEAMKKVKEAQSLISAAVDDPCKLFCYFKIGCR
jgi:predicted Holliday junction resolvase-like endonuclease